MVMSAVFEFILCGVVKPLGGKDTRTLVELGVARFRNDEDDMTVDEPVAILAAATYLTTHTTWSLRGLLSVNLTTSNASARGLSFEQYVGFLLAIHFRSPRPLHRVFEFFRSTTKLRNKCAHLVAMAFDDGNFTCTPVDIASYTGPHHKIGCSPSSTSATLKWLKNPQNTAICFPPNAVGPDVILTLQLDDDTIIRVLIQCKHHTKGSLSDTETEAAFRSIDPAMMAVPKNAEALDITTQT
jgi:hypothetical protein